MTSDHALSNLVSAGRRRLKRLLGDPRTSIADDPRDVARDVYAGAELSFAYVLLSACSCGIAVFGLLQSSAAVVIGAMLISPLMGPIIGMGVALAELQPRRFLRAGASLAAGAALSILVAALIVWLSPLKDVTPEILARTRPNLLDLAIALLSGVVGAYVTITRRGGVIAGVAIATALMPPVAVTGYGLATGDWAIAGGSFLLFLTNVVAILGAVLVVARGYGFKRPARHGIRWEEILLGVILLSLATPLGFSLRDIVIEARQTDQARSAINRVFANASPQITSLVVEADRKGIRKIAAVVVSTRYVAGAPTAVRNALGTVGDVHIEQILAATRASLSASSGGALANHALSQDQTTPDSADPTARLTALLSQVATVNIVKSGPSVLDAVVELHQPSGLPEYEALEAASQRFFPGVSVTLTPPLSSLEPISFGEGQSRLDSQAVAAVGAAAWALKRWGVAAVTVTGSASPGRHGPTARDHRLALARAQAVASSLENLGTRVTIVAETVPQSIGGETTGAWSAEIRPAPLAAHAKIAATARR